NSKVSFVIVWCTRGSSIAWLGSVSRNVPDSGTGFSGVGGYA
ncbi:hypothetical protein LINPERPRIM_LOCUS27795, partial [Linum perenne]